MVYCICEVPNGKLYDSERNCRQMENHRTASSNSLQNKSYSRGNTSKPNLVDPIECIKTNKTIIGDRIPLYNVIPDKGDFRRRIRPNRVMCEDHFPKQTRNIDYSDIETEFFSSDHLYYADDGYKGFADYSVVGEEYSETGFAPYAVAIHIVYFDTKNILRIAHFVSDSNDDISDPARKFAEAVKKLVEWNKTMKLDTVGIREFEAAYRNKTYPGLGVVKKYSIMHHLELMSKYLDGVAI